MAADASQSVNRPSAARLLLVCTIMFFCVGLFLKRTNNADHKAPPTFYEVALKHRTDKVTTHQYHHFYQRYLGPIRTEKLKLLEIGLGCGMAWGVGASLYTWMEWLPSVDLYYLEFNATCARSFQAKMPNVTIFIGDQSDEKLLQKIIIDTGGNFDSIVDDGGHEFHQQITSLNVLFHALKPGGTYFVEDLEPGYIRKPHHKGRATMQYIQILLDDMVAARREPRRENLTRDMFSIDCMADICALTKLRADQRIPGWLGYKI